MCQRICTEGPLGQGVKQLAVGYVRGGKQVYLSVPEAFPNQLEYLGVESTILPQGGLTSELVGCTIELAWDMNGAKRPQMLLTPKEEMACDRDHQVNVGNDHIQKHMSGKPSLKRRPSLVELF